MFKCIRTIQYMQVYTLLVAVEIRGYRNGWLVSKVKAGVIVYMLRYIIN